MKIAFQKDDPSTLASIIRWWTGSIYSHCEILFDDGRMFSAHFADGGTRFWTPGILSPNAWDVLEISTNCDENERIRAFCGGELGCRYDLKGIFFSQILRMQREHPKRWFCSEICTAALQRINLITGAKACTFSPGKLHKRLREAGAVPCAS